MTATKLHTQDAAVNHQERKEDSFTALVTIYTVCNKIAMTTLTLGRCVLIISERFCVRLTTKQEKLLPPTWAHPTNIHTLKRKITKCSKIRVAVKIKLQLHLTVCIHVQQNTLVSP